MASRLKHKNKNKLRLSRKLVFIITLLSISALLLSISLIYLNFLETKSTEASVKLQPEDGNISSDILYEFTWEHDPLKATIGPDALSISEYARIMEGGRFSTKGLSPGKNAENINLVLPSAHFKPDGIDISIDFRKLEPTGSLFCKEKSLDFWIKRGYPAVLYKTYNVNGGYAMVDESSAYEIPNDGQWRNYRFIYNPVSGKGEIFVNGVIVWSHQGEPNSALYWVNEGNIIIGKDMNGNGHNEAIFDNLVIRSLGKVISPAESLIGFQLEKKHEGILLRWSASEFNRAKSFRIERSTNGIDFTKISEIKVETSTGEKVYEYFDNLSLKDGVYYYRLKQLLKDGKSINHLSSAIKYKSNQEPNDLIIRNAEFVGSESSINVLFNIPESGKGWLQLKDDKGNILKTETFDGTQGPNMYTLHQIQNLNLTKGNYTISLIFNDKKVSRKLIPG